MVAVNPYLIFNGTCEEAFLFYKSVFGGEFPFMEKYGAMPSEQGLPEISDTDKNRVMHVSLPISSETILMGSDSNFVETETKMGDAISISIDASSKGEADKLFNGLSRGGIVKMPLNDTFWGAYFGMFTDKFGINWVVNFDAVKN